MSDVYVGLDLSTQSLSGLIYEAVTGQVLWESSVNYDECLPHYGTTNGTLSQGSCVHSPPGMWVEALDVFMDRLSHSGIALSRVKGVSGAAQQHGSVYLNKSFIPALASLDASQSLYTQLVSVYSRPLSPVWLDASTQEECTEIEGAFQSLQGDRGSHPSIADVTGSDVTMRFTGPQIRAFMKRSPEQYAATETIHLVSSYLSCLLVQGAAPIDTADASGMNMLDISTGVWHEGMCECVAGQGKGQELLDKLPGTVPSATVIGCMGPYWVERWGFSPETPVVVCTGDNPASLVGLGVCGGEEAVAGVSLGTSDVYMGVSAYQGVSEGQDHLGHVLVSPMSRTVGGSLEGVRVEPKTPDEYMTLLCFSNGSLAREAVRREQGVTSWADYAALMDTVPVGNRGRVMLPYYAEECTPPRTRGVVRSEGLDASDAAANCRGVYESQMLAMRLHTAHLPAPSCIHVTGGACADKALLQVLADVYGCPVVRMATSGAALGAALRAYQAVSSMSWASVYSTVQPSPHPPVMPCPNAVKVYEQLLELIEPEASHLAKDLSVPFLIRDVVVWWLAFYCPFEWPRKILQTRAFVFVDGIISIPGDYAWLEMIVKALHQRGTPLYGTIMFSLIPGMACPMLMAVLAAMSAPSQSESIPPPALSDLMPSILDTLVIAGGIVSPLSRSMTMGLAMGLQAVRAVGCALLGPRFNPLQPIMLLVSFVLRLGDTGSQVRRSRRKTPKPTEKSEKEGASTVVRQVAPTSSTPSGTTPSTKGSKKSATPTNVPKTPSTGRGGKKAAMLETPAVTGRRRNKH
ncbi:hypothetical protein KIPB_002495 [Kipferlia bialata]|uniref:Carbohydrate kinase FGGY C-terminal domain-containing protein n=1 Tax=Kipferlia bialata TaxID=797122 RepID=A0A9K3GF07_9EUKA|nr:hypothetical protein KIPB_002495 [Kipferlia bialata]|eukprot:g2495.t1